MPHPIALGPDLSPEKIFHADSPASSSTEQISASISPAPSTGVPAAASTLPPTPPVLRNGTIIKGHRRSLSRLQPATGYKMKEKSQPTEGKWVFIVNGAKLKQWEQVAPKLLKQLSLVEVRDQLEMALISTRTDFYLKICAVCRLRVNRAHPFYFQNKI